MGAAFDVGGEDMKLLVLGKLERLELLGTAVA